MDSKIIIKFAGYELKAGAIIYKIIHNSGNQTYQLSARYSELRKIHESLKEKYSDLPEFPPKTWLKDTSDAFASQRQKALEHYFSNLVKKYNLDQLPALKEFLKEGKKVNAPKIEENVVTKFESNQMDTTVIDKIVGEVSGKFYNMKDVPGGIDEEELKKRKKFYKDMKIDMGSLLIYRLPTGNENNLMTLQDEISWNKDTLSAMEDVLDKLKFLSHDIPFLSNPDLVYHVK